MNSITINGVSSDTITGLIIQELPPITKPPIRNQIEEIDGRDGDIVTKLGYGAYDKVISIGLSFNYDINQIISFFNSEGTIIFSNEPTKYYKFQILEQIDFEKLIRFKTANVTIHCQPFKYLLDEAPINFDTNTATGKNLFNAKNVGTGSRTTIDIIDTGIKAICTSTNRFCYGNFIIGEEELQGKTLTLSCNMIASGTNSCRALLYGLNSSKGLVAGSTFGDTLNASGSITTTIPSTLPTNVKYVALLLYSNADSTTAQIGDYCEYTNVQVEIGSSPTSYEPFTNTLNVSNLGNIFSRPKIKIYGKETCGIYLDNHQLFSIDFDDTGNDYLTIDCEKMEAYKDNLETLRNRDVTGDYSNFILNVGENAIDFSDNVSGIVIENYNRWL